MKHHSTPSRKFASIITATLLMAAACYSAQDTNNEPAETAAPDEPKSDTPLEINQERPKHSQDKHVGFDIERNMEVYDIDGDTFPDITEELIGSDPRDPQSLPSPMSASFPLASCRPGFQQAGARLCITTATQNSANYANAVSSCRNRYARVCTHEDMMYLYLNSSLDASYNPVNRAWLGNMVHDDTVLCGNASITFNNDPEIYNFEGHCNKAEYHPYWCCHDDDG